MNEVIRQWLQVSLRNLFQYDWEIIERQLKEECINHRLAVYIEKNKPLEYENYYVDIEYNKNADKHKQIRTEHGPRNVRPDILVHMRTDDVTDNLIAFECKLGYLKESDKGKLRGFLTNGFNYQICLGIGYQPRRDYFIVYERNTWFSIPRRIDKRECRID